MALYISLSIRLSRLLALRLSSFASSQLYITASHTIQIIVRRVSTGDASPPKLVVMRLIRLKRRESVAQTTSFSVPTPPSLRSAVSICAAS